jgi:hypothetical protein
VKLIASPGTSAGHGWRTGQFPPPFAEWNDRFRDGARSSGSRRPSRSRTASQPAGSGTWRHGSRARPTSSPRTAGRSRRSTSSPRTTGSPSPTWSPTTTSTTSQRRGQPRRDAGQPVVEPRRRGPDGRTRDPGRPPAGRSATCSARCCSRPVCR